MIKSSDEFENVLLPDALWHCNISDVLVVYMMALVLSAKVFQCIFTPELTVVQLQIFQVLQHFEEYSKN